MAISVPMTVPRPPAKLAPPKITAVTTDSRYVAPTWGLAAASCAVTKDSGKTAGCAGENVEKGLR